MTVAIAALCGIGGPGGPLIVCAEDHMITAGDVQFEQPQPKMWRLGKGAVALIYGDSAVQAEIALQTEKLVAGKDLSDVREIAMWHAVHLRAHMQRQAEAAVLLPLGLTRASFLAKQRTMNADLVLQLSEQLQNHYKSSGAYYELGGAIIVGADVLGGHIYRVEHGQAEYIDAIGFVAAGSGQWHAESQFMFSRYTRFWDFPSALSLVYAAKKRAEVAPGVGTETDIVLIFTNPVNVMFFGPDAPLLKRLEEIWQETRNRIKWAESHQYEEVRKFMDSLPKASNDQPASTPSNEPSAATSSGTVAIDKPATNEPQRKSNPPDAEGAARPAKESSKRSSKPRRLD